MLVTVDMLAFEIRFPIPVFVKLNMSATDYIPCALILRFPIFLHRNP